MKSFVISNNLLLRNSPASSIENDLLEGLSKYGVEINSFCSSRGILGKKSTFYETVIITERIIWRYIFAVIRLILPDLCYLPDYQYISWGWRVRKRIRKQLKTDNVDYVHSFSFACSCHIVALKIHKEFGIPWIATFFDSWTDYPARRYRTKFFRRMDQRLERSVAENATVIVHTNEGIAKLWADRYGNDIIKKTVVIPLNVNFSGLKRKELRADNKNIVKISHIGTFYPQRDASAFIEGVNRFTQQYPQLRDRIKINFVGRTIESDRKKIEKYELNDLFNLTGPLPIDECSKYYEGTDIFLSTAGVEFERISYPSKIMKYFYYERPILGITPKDTVLEIELRKSGHHYYEPCDVDGISKYIFDAINNYSSICKFDRDYWKRFSVDNVVDHYLDVIDKYINNKKK